MATINGLTAERMQEIIDKTIVDADVVGDNLILTLHDDTTIDAGNVRGEPGEPGVTDMEAQIAAALNLADPPGTPKPYTSDSPPTGHGLCDAGTEYSSATYPLLAVLYGTGPGCINGASTVGTFRLPNLKGRILVGRDAAVGAFDTLHETGGSKDAVVVQHAHLHDHTGDTGGPSQNHTHGIDHDHGVLAETGTGNQFITYDGVGTVQAGPDFVAPTGYAGTASAPSPDISAGQSQDHAHTILADDSNTDDGVSGTDKNLQPYRVINWVMRLA